jgi:hypothetical protein
LGAILVAAIALAGASSANGQTATANASAQIFKPLTITSTAQMSFGRLLFTANNGPQLAHVVLASQPPVGRTTDYAQLLPNGNETPAIRSLSGQPGASYRVSVSNAASTPGGLLINTFTVWSANSGNITSGLGTLSSGGTDTVRIGATLNVPRGTNNDTYTATPTILITYD